MRCDVCMRAVHRHAREVFVSFGLEIFGTVGCGRRYFCGMPCAAAWMVATVPLVVVAEIERAAEPGAFAPKVGNSVTTARVFERPEEVEARAIPPMREGSYRAEMRAAARRSRRWRSRG